MPVSFGCTPIAVEANLAHYALKVGVYYGLALPIVTCDKPTPVIDFVPAKERSMPCCWRDTGVEMDSS